MSKYIGHGAALAVDPAGGSTYNTIVQVKGIGSLNPETGSVETTTLDSANNAKEFKPGLIDAGTFSATIAWDPAETDHQVFTTLQNNRAIATWKITTPDGAKTTIWSGFVTSFVIDPIESESLLTASISVKNTGVITWPA